MKRHYHPNPERELRERGFVTPVCKNAPVRDLSHVTDDADTIIGSPDGCKACQRMPEFPDNVQRPPWNRRMIDAANEIRRLTQKAQGETVEVSLIRGIFEKHGL